jgi:hypothetical protein
MYVRSLGRCPFKTANKPNVRFHFFFPILLFYESKLLLFTHTSVLVSLHSQLSVWVGEWVSSVTVVGVWRSEAVRMIEEEEEEVEEVIKTDEVKVSEWVSEWVGE